MFFCFNDTATTEIYTLSLHDALPIWSRLRRRPRADRQALLHKLRRAPLRPGQGPLLTARRGWRANPRPLHVEWPPRALRPRRMLAAAAGCAPAPPVSTFAVQVTAVQVVDHDDGELLNKEPEDCLGTEILVCDDLGLLHAVGQESGRPLHGSEVDAAVPAHRFEHLLRARALADRAPQAAFD